MADKIQNAYEASKNIYDDVLTQGNFFSRMYMEIIGIYIVRLTPPPRRQGSKRHFLLKPKLFIGKICAVCTKTKAVHCIFVVIWACKKPPAFGRGLNFREREIT